MVLLRKTKTSNPESEPQTAVDLGQEERRFSDD